jgi:hypothetical protein
MQLSGALASDPRIIMLLLVVISALNIDIPSIEGSQNWIQEYRISLVIPVDMLAES